MKKFLILITLIGTTLSASIGEITALKGEASILRQNQTYPVKVGTKLQEHDLIKTMPRSKLQIVFNDKTVISLGQKSRLRVDEYIYSKKKVSARFSVGKGIFKSITGKIGKISPKMFKIKTANATIGVRGTTIIGEVSPQRDIIACSYGQIEVSTNRGSILVNAGERTIVEQTKAPRHAEKINKVILKLLDKKSDPSVKEVESTSKTDPKQNLSTKKSNIEERKSYDKFEPWIKNKELHSLEDIENIIGESKPTYKGKITNGSTSNGQIDTKSSSVVLGFDLGNGKMDGDIRFNDSVSDYDIKVDGKLKGDGSFNFNSHNGYDGGGRGTLSGDNLEHANGDMHFIEQRLDGSTNNIDADFETRHQR